MTNLCSTTKEAAMKARIAQLEDSIRAADRASAGQAMRPNLHKSSMSTNCVSPVGAMAPALVEHSAGIPVICQKGLTYRVTRPPSSASMRSEEPVENVAIDVDADGGVSDGMTGIPPKSMVDSESDGLGVGEWEDKGEDDEDFVMQQNQSDDEEAVPISVKGKQVAKGKKNKAPPRGTFHQDIQELRQNPAVAGAVVSTNKRKDVVTVEDAPSVKRGKKTDGGLLPGWKKQVGYQLGMKKQTLPAQNVDNDQDDCDKLGEFDQEETLEGLAAVQASKLSMVKIRDGQKGVELKTKITENGASGAAYVAKWKKVACTMIIDRGAVELCAYAAIGAFMPLVVQDIWREVFPDLDMYEYMQSSAEEPVDAIIALAGDVLTNWRSTIGTSALQVLSNFFRDQSFAQDDIIAYCKTERLNFKFIYQDPLAPAGKKGALQSDLILEVFTCHFKKTAFAAKSYGLPVGGLGLSTAALECALSLWSSGMDPIRDEKGNKKTVQMFGESEWGEKSCSWISVATRLAPKDWASILAEANTRAGIFSADDDDDHDEDSVDPQTLVELCLPSTLNTKIQQFYLLQPHPKHPQFNAIWPSHGELWSFGSRLADFQVNLGDQESWQHRMTGPSPPKQSAILLIQSKPVRHTCCAWAEHQELRSRVFILEGRDVGNVPVYVDINEVITKVESIWKTKSHPITHEQLSSNLPPIVMDNY
ncbi:uncharacterized protein LACBIDRAFT_329357 [Laccaria bicolor S238N-H82]|uniref:Predicted protein n=1 Tax=Laccaria bicolor (strain S238N-H82 / ATCC MYA-4686) TaxID=486041 RepID=B0DHT0_LACBS|nr:uncharacterized protein LACBIDRAFT_329357 [Laccaria bicolor S238N-H82]EDR05886.1 predicted protein [Laccaria bicolor S238N-H82]|eukprot:XP_001883562.1 predicted protein [Laccaria bicolor S238N-H82]